MLRTKYQWLARQNSPISPVWHSVGGSGTPTVVEEEPRARYQCRYSRVTPTNLQSLELTGVVIQALPESKALVFGQVCRSIQRPAHQFPGYRIERWCITHFQRISVSLRLFQKAKEQKQKGQPHREDSTATTQRNPTLSRRLTGDRRRRYEASRWSGS